MSDDHKIPEERAALYYIGNVLTVVGILLFVSVIVEGFAGFNNGPSFDPSSGPNPMRALLGMGIMVVGGICRAVGVGGLAGSGILIDPQRERQELKPWSKMAGGMMNDALEEVEVVKNTSSAGQEVIKVRCPSCRTLNDENAKFCDQCGQAL